MILQISWGRRRGQSVDQCKRKRSGVIQIGGAQPLAEVEPAVAINLGGGEATVLPDRPSRVLSIPGVPAPVVTTPLVPTVQDTSVRGMLGSQLSTP